MQTRKVENIFHILEFGFRCVCYPTTILYEKNIWRRMLPSNREYAIVNNFFVLFPYFILLTKVSPIVSSSHYCLIVAKYND